MPGGTVAEEDVQDVFNLVLRMSGNEKARRPARHRLSVGPKPIFSS